MSASFRQSIALLGKWSYDNRSRTETQAHSVAEHEQILNAFIGAAHCTPATHVGQMNVQGDGALLYRILGSYRYNT